jgi:Zn-finger nucleic acid-binding protein
MTAMTHKCPDCQVPLRTESFEGLSIEECPQCAGIWILDQDLKRLEAEGAAELERLDAAGKPSRTPSPAPSTRPCPACNLIMERFHFAYNTPVVLDRCTLCEGLWIDDGELTGMAAVLHAEEHPEHDPATAKAEAALVMARFEMEHERTMDRYRMITKICRGLSWRMWWYWL